MSHAVLLQLKSTINSRACDPALHTAIYNCQFLWAKSGPVLDDSVVAPVQQSAAGQIFRTQSQRIAAGLGINSLNRSTSQ